MTIEKEIERIVNKYPREDSKLLFKSELESLVEVVRKEQDIECKKAYDKWYDEWASAAADDICWRHIV